jgi:hypothetical protein
MRRILAVSAERDDLAEIDIDSEALKSRAVIFVLTDGAAVIAQEGSERAVEVVD